MKFAVRSVLLALLATLTFTSARADGPVSIGLNGGGQPSQDAHIEWLRVTWYWSFINPSWGVYDFSGLDPIIDDAQMRGQKVMLILSGAPSWCGGGSNGATPCNIEFWKSYVDQVSSRYAGRIAAYEIWNEPDLSNQAAYGVGWDPDINTYPRYVDYLAEAARIIRRNTCGPLAVVPNACGTLVVGPAMSKSTSRSVSIWEQLDQTFFPDGNASDFLDVISFHHTTTDAGAHSEDVAWDIHNRITDIIRRFNPRNGYKPMWVTEFGWKVQGIHLSESTQQVRTKNLLIEMGGGGFHILSGFNIPRAFIYRQGGCDGDEGYGIYRCDNSPRPVITNYLWLLPFPATQDPSVPRE
jgi:hypothetical protein